jgi:hypothetical protein
LKNKFDVYYNEKKNIAHLQLTKSVHASILTHSLTCDYPEIGESTHLFYPNRIDPRFRELEKYLQLFCTIVNEPQSLGLLTLNIGGLLVPVHSLHHIDDSMCRLIGQVTANVLPLDPSEDPIPIWSWTFTSPPNREESANLDEPYGMLTFKRLEPPEFTIKNLLTGEYLVLNKSTSEVPTQIELGSQSQLSHIETPELVIESDSTSQSWQSHHSKITDTSLPSTPSQICPDVTELNSTAALSQTPRIEATNSNAPSTSSKTRHTPSTIRKRQKDGKMVSLLRKKAIMNCFVKKHNNTKITKKVSALKRNSDKKRKITAARKTNMEETYDSYESMKEISAIMFTNEEMQQSLLARWGYGGPQDFNKHKKVQSEKIKTARQCKDAAEKKHIVESVVSGNF